MLAPSRGPCLSRAQFPSSRGLFRLLEVVAAFGLCLLVLARQRCCGQGCLVAVAGCAGCEGVSSLLMLVPFGLGLK